MSNKINNLTDTKQTWSKVRSLEGIKHGNKIQLSENNCLISDPYVVANKFGKYVNIFFITVVFKITFLNLLKKYKIQITFISFVYKPGRQNPKTSLFPTQKCPWANF